jgi:hypothetical protein
MKVGVLLPPPPEDLGEWLADAAALDAAGADALWVHAGAEPGLGAGLDPLAVAAALAALTFRSLLVTALPEASGDRRARARTLATIDRLSRGRLALCGGTDPQEVPDAPEVPEAGFFHLRDEDVFAHDPAGGEPERWVRIGLPEGRAAWRVAIAAAAEQGAVGVLVPAGPQLLDILRNPDGRGDRRDLQLAQG